MPSHPKQSMTKAVSAIEAHPEEDGLIAFTLLMVLTPILSFVVLFGSRKRKMQEQQRTIARQ
jgi:hypothetical protein